MTKKEAIEILLKGAVRFSNGVGLGISTGITSKDRKDIAEAIKIVWPYLYEHKIRKSELSNLHISEY